MSCMKTLEGMMNRTTLSTQRVLHTHILALGEQFCPPSSTTSRSPSQVPGMSPLCHRSEQGEVGGTQEDFLWMEAFIQRAEEDTERALKQQAECLQVCFKEAQLAKERLETEQRQGERVEQQAQFEERCVGLWAEMERQISLKVEESCERMRAKMERQAEEDRQREAEAIHAQAKEDVRRCVWETEVCVRQQCEKEAQRDRQILQDTHVMDLSQMQSRLRQLEESLATVTGERMQYEHEFKMLQCSYRQFVDLTDSLHSDYLLKLRYLGREPVFTEAGVQTPDW